MSVIAKLGLQFLKLGADVPFFAMVPLLGQRSITGLRRFLISFSATFSCDQIVSGPSNQSSGTVRIMTFNPISA
jgi:hypothetical protein